LLRVASRLLLRFAISEHLTPLQVCDRFNLASHPHFRPIVSAITMHVCDQRLSVDQPLALQLHGCLVVLLVVCPHWGSALKRSRRGVLPAQGNEDLQMRELNSKTCVSDLFRRDMI